MMTLLHIKPPTQGRGGHQCTNLRQQFLLTAKWEFSFLKKPGIDGVALYPVLKIDAADHLFYPTDYFFVKTCCLQHPQYNLAALLQAEIQVLVVANVAMSQ